MSIKRDDSRPTVLLLCLFLALLPGLIAREQGKAVEPTDAEVRSAVEEALAFDSSVNSNAIEVGTKDGVATVSGVVDDILEKERALRIVQSVRGIRSVVDQIEVDPPFRADFAINADVEEALIQDPATDAYELRSETDEGIVVLSGSVDSWQEQQLAVHVAKGVKGVKGILSNIVVDYASKRPDAEIEADVRRSLEIDAWVDESSIDVDVSEGVVSLSGSVGSSVEQIRAVNDAWLAGVKKVLVEEVEVEPWDSQENPARDERPGQSDEWIREAVQDALIFDPRVISTHSDVTAENGVVTLSGTVDNLKAKRAAERTAKNTTGVWRVENFLQVRSGVPIGDDLIESNIKDAMAWNPVLEGFEITVEVDDGIATLSGTVDSYFEKSEAEDVVQRQNGIVAIENELAVGFPHRAFFDYNYDPFLDLEPYYFGSTDPDRPNRSDAEIKADIEDEFFWSPFVDGRDITVTVDNGVVTLSGKVDGWAESHSAVENAFEGGALRVVDNLIVG